MSRRRPILTAAHLRAAGACREQVALFRRTFPGDGAALTLANLKRARAAGLDVDWCRALMDAPAQTEYERALTSARAEHTRAVASARAEYERAVASARAEHTRAFTSAQAEYDRATAPALAEYKRATAPARAEYKRATAPARAEYERATAPARAEYERATDRALLAGLVATFNRRQQEGGVV